MFSDLQNQVFKYYSPRGAISALRESTLCYSRVDSFNDPFELFAGFSFSKRYDEGAFLRKLGILENYRILSLTRSWDNPLMWSHYACSYHGVVVGYCKDCFELNNSAVLPLKIGSVIYSRTLPVAEFSHSELPKVFDGSLDEFDPIYLEALQRIYLYKASCWSYEEEVRVVKQCNKINCFDEINDGKGMLEQIDPRMVRSVVFGHNFRPGVLADKRGGVNLKYQHLTKEWVGVLQDKYSFAKFYCVDFDEKRYDLRLRCIDGSLIDYFSGISDVFHFADWNMRT